MPFSNKLIAVTASAAVLVGGGITLAVTTPSTPVAPLAAVPAPVARESVTVTADGSSTVVEVAQLSVASALVGAGIELRAADRVVPALGSTLAAGDTVTVERVSTMRWTRSVPLSFTSTNVNDPTLAKGKTKVKTEGVAGEKIESLVTTSVKGTVEGIEVVSEEVTREPVNEVILVGTKVPVAVTSRSTTRTESAAPKKSQPEKSQPKQESAPKAPADAGNTGGAGLNLANEAMWDRIAKCESTGRWNINTGNGYYGGLQFDLPTWRSVGGTDFAAYPHQASRAEQITVANRLYAKRGLQPWGCRHAA